MLWDRSNRFTTAKKDEKILTYESFSDYLRHQFLQSRNLFHHYQEYRKSQKQKKYKHDPRKIHHDFQSPHHHEEGITPATSLTEDAPKDDGRNENTFFLTQTNEGDDDIPHTRRPISTQTQPSERQDQIQRSKKKKNNKLILLKSKVLPSYLDNTMPGPGSYHHPESLVKPSFNRVYTEPPPANSTFDTSKKKSVGLRNYLRPTTAIKKRMESKPLWNGTRENRPILSRSMSAPVTLDNTTHRPASVKPYAETHKNPYSSAKASLTPDGSPRKKKGNIYGTRYPPVSEKIIRRWISYSHDSYPDYSKPSLLSPHAKTMLSKRQNEGNVGYQPG